VTSPSPSTVRAAPGKPAVSVVVPTVDRVHLLERCLRGLAAQRDVSFEVLVVHDGNPAVVRLLERWADAVPLRALGIAASGASAKRNAGWQHAQADVVAFTDDDCEPAPEWLRAALPALDDDDVALVQGKVLAHPDDARVDGRYARTIEVTGPLQTFPNANLFYRRAALAEAGGYDERLTAGEDTDLAWRVIGLGGQPRFLASSLVWHAVRPVGFVGHLRSLPRWRSLPEVVKRHPELRQLAYRRYFWKNTHPKAWLALLGLALAVRQPAALALAVPHVLARRHPGLLVSDWLECAVMAGGSLRWKAILL
jgi:GT2 family glycosyltransferase